MTIEIRVPDLERLVEEEMRHGSFKSVDDVLAEALQALREKRARTPTADEPRETAGTALKLPVRHLGAMGPLHRRDIYDDVR